MDMESSSLFDYDMRPSLLRNGGRKARNSAHTTRQGQHENETDATTENTTETKTTAEIEAAEDHPHFKWIRVDEVPSTSDENSQTKENASSQVREGGVVSPHAFDLPDTKI